MKGNLFNYVMCMLTMMVLQSTGSITFSQIQTEFGGANPISMSEYYLNASSGYAANVSGIPNTGSELKCSQFLGKAKYVAPSGSNTVPTAVATVFTGTYVWSGGGSTGYEWLTGCSGENLSRTGVSTFNNIWTQGAGRSNVIYYADLILQARPGDTIRLVVHGAAYGYTEVLRGWINLGGGYYQIGYGAFYIDGNGGSITCDYTIPASTAPGNYALAGMLDYAGSDGSYRSVNYYSLHIW